MKFLRDGVSRERALELKLCPHFALLLTPLIRLETEKQIKFLRLSCGRDSSEHKHLWRVQKSRA